MCALALAVVFFDVGCSLSFETGPFQGGDDGGPDGLPSNEAGIPDSDAGSTNDGDADTGTPPKQQPPKFISASTDSRSGSSAFNVARPANTAQGDLLVAAVYVKDSDNTITFPTGWSVIDQRSLPECEGFTTWAYHLVGSSEPSTYTVGITFTRDLQEIAIVAYRGVDRSRPIGPHNVTPYKSTLLYGPVTLTTDQPNQTLLLMASNKAGTGWSVPSGMQTPAPVNTNVLGIFDEPRPNAGATDPRTAVSSGTSADSCGDVALVALRPAPL